MKRYLRYGAWSMVALLLVAGTGLWWLAGTNAGAQWLLAQIPRLAPVAIKQDSMTGTLWSGLTLRNLHAAAGPLMLDAAELAFSWNPLPLLHGRLSITELRLSGARISDERPPAPSTGFQWPDLGGTRRMPALRINALALNDITYQRSGKPPVRIPSAQAALFVRTDTAEITGLDLVLPDLRIQGKASLGLVVPHVRADAVIFPAQPVAGMNRFAVSTDLIHGNERSVLEGPISAKGMTGSKEQYTARAGISITHSLLKIHQLELARPHKRGSISVTGETAIEGPVQFDGVLEANDLDLSREIAGLEHVTARIRVRGGPDRYDGRISLNTRGAALMNAALEAMFRGDRGELTLSDLNAQWLGGRIAGKAVINIKNAPSLRTSLRIRGIDPSVAAKDWPGRINGYLAASVDLPSKEKPGASVSLSLDRSTLRGEPFSGRIEAGLKKGSVVLDRLLLKGRGIDVRAQGSLEQRITFSASLAGLGLIQQNYKGSASASGWIGKRGSNLYGEVRAQGTGLDVLGVSAEKIDLQATAEQQLDRPFSVTVRVRNGRYHDIRIDTLSLSASGTAPDHAISLSLDSEGYRLATHATGSFKDNTWQGTIDALQGSDKSGAWRLQEPVAVVVSREQLSLSPFVLAGQGDERIQAQADVTFAGEYAGSFSLSWQDLNIGRLNAWLADTNLSGTTTGAVSGRFLPGNKMDARGSAAIANGKVSRRVGQVELHADVKTAVLSLAWRDRLEATLSLALGEYGELELKLGLPLPAAVPLAMDEQGQVRATVTGRMREMGVVSLLFPGLVQDSHGQLNVDLSAAGTWAAPRITGAILLDKAGAYLPAAGIKVTDITMRVELQKDTVRITSFSAASGKGRLNGSAKIALEGWQPVSFEGRLQGDKFQALFLPRMQMLITPDLTVKGMPGRLEVRGDVKVPEFLLYGPPVEGPVKQSEDVVIVGVPEEKSTPALETDIRVKVVLGDRVIVKAAGVDAQMKGEITVTAASLERITGAGEMSVVKGKYSAYGVSLDISRGKIFFTGGPVRNPSLDILALHNADTVKAGVLVTGTLEKPVVKLYSEPAMPDTDILAYIVLGHPLGQDKAQGNLMMKAASALLSAGQSVALQDQVKSRLGVDTIDIESGTTSASSTGFAGSTASGYASGTTTQPPPAPTGTTGGQVSRSVVTIGKYITSSLYVSYGYAVFTGENVFKLRYKFGRHWELESHSGETSGADLYYTIQFD